MVRLIFEKMVVVEADELDAENGTDLEDLNSTISQDSSSSGEMSERNLLLRRSKQL